MKKVGIIFVCIFSVFLSSLIMASCGRKTVAVTDISYPANIELFLGQSTFLIPTLSPCDAYNFKLTYSSSDKSIATVNNKGYVTAVGYGKAIITCSVENANEEEKLVANCEVSVTDGDIFKIYIEEDSLNQIYYEGQTFTLGEEKVYACYESGKELLLEKGQYQISLPSPLIVGSELEVTYQGFTDKIKLNVVQDYMTNIVVSSQPNKLQYFIGESFDSTGMVIESVWASGNRKVVTDYIFDNEKLDYLDSSVNITYNGFSTEINITVKANYQVSNYTQLQNVIDSASDGESIMLTGWHSNVSTIYIPASKNLYIYGEVNKNVSINTREGSPAFIITGEGSLTLANLTLTATDGTELIIEESQDKVELNLIDIAFNY